MKEVLVALNHPAKAYEKGNRFVSWGLVLLTILFNAFLNGLFNLIKDGAAINVVIGLELVVKGIIAYLLIVGVFWSVCKCFGCKRKYLEHLSSWGLSFFPTALCAIAVAYSEAYFTLFWNNSIGGMIISIIFVGILLWKILLFIIYMKNYAGLVGLRLIGAFLVLALAIAFAAPLEGYFGIMTPVI